ncbi:M20/M25/M40 family metallo-hydrolase [Thermoleophilia bacterium SCSIO 60948]|nr:M20/M25/M40 family metallo-hydrolase [Thermoleophilia bacterium SCSIO 60948]
MSVADDLRDEVVELARRLIAVDTSNPPGGETRAAELLASYLRANGIEPELCGPDPERLNLVARVRGRDEAPSLLLMAHTDVVPAPPENWTVDPFEGVVRDGRLVGRGACDMKGELAARAVALAACARRGVPPAGDVVLIAEADEERNTAEVGMSWLVRGRPDLRADLAINEGGGSLYELTDGRRVVPISVGEKRVSSLRVRVHGRSSHASVPDDSDNPLRHAAEATQRLLDARAPAEPTPALERALAILSPGADGLEAAIEAARPLHPSLDSALPSTARMTVTPTGLATHEPSNVIPPYADVVCDVRALPHHDEDTVLGHVAAALEGVGFRWQVEFLEPLEGGTESSLDTPLYRAIEDWLAERLPGAALVPLVSSGFTDSHWVRDAWGTAAYGFAPVFATDQTDYARSMHGADEAIEIDDLAEMAAFNLAMIEALGDAR